MTDETIGGRAGELRSAADAVPLAAANELCDALDGLCAQLADLLGGQDEVVGEADRASTVAAGVVRALAQLRTALHAVGDHHSIGGTGRAPAATVDRPAGGPRRGAASEWAWAQQAAEKLPARQRRSPTTGRVRGLGPDSDRTMTSGGGGKPVRDPETGQWRRQPRSPADETAAEREERELVERIDQFLLSSDRFPLRRRDLGPPAVSDHVETKAAMRLREARVTSGAVCINNTICDGMLNCVAAVRAILPAGSTLAVWEPGASTPIEITGEAT